jgi:hypothetical protein
MHRNAQVRGGGRRIGVRPEDINDLVTQAALVPGQSQHFEKADHTPLPLLRFKTRPVTLEHKGAQE